MAGATKLMTPGGGGVNLTPASSIASDVTLQLPVTADTLAGQSYVNSYTQGIGFKNRIINGNMNIFQRGTAASTLNVPTYFVDRWAASVVGTGMGYGANQATDGSISQNGLAHIYIQTSTAKASLAVGDYALLQQNIEGQNIADFKFGTASAKAFTFSFRAAATTATTVSIAFRNGASNRSYVTTVSMTTTPTNYSITVPGDTTGTWAVDNTNGLAVTFCFAANTAGTFTTSTLNAWQAGNYIAANTQSNGLDTLNRAISFSDVQLEKGSVATPFEVRPYGTELVLCQRYFEKAAVLYGTATYNYVYSYKVNKRASPTITGTITNGTGGSYATLSDDGGYTLAFQNAGNSATSGGYIMISAEL